MKTSPTHTLMTPPTVRSADRAPTALRPAEAPRLTKLQWLICAVAGLGFAFDLYESLMAALIVGPVLSTLGGLQPGSPQFNHWVGLFFFLPAAVGGAFGLAGGFFTDVFGRRRVLVWSIMLYGFSAFAASFASSLPLLLLLRCTTMIGVCVEAVAAIAWLAELFPIPRQRETVLGYTQACYAAGGLLVAGAYFLAVTYAERLPAIAGHHDAWRYTLLSGLLPAIPLMIARPFLPESPLWRKQRADSKLVRPSVSALFQPALRRSTLVTMLMMACLLAIPYGALQHTPRIVPGLAALHGLTAREIEQRVSAIYLIQELGSVTGRLMFACVVVRVASRVRLLRLFLVPALILLPAVFFFATSGGLLLFTAGIFVAQALFNAMHSFSGNYLPRVFPTYLRGTGESFAMNVGGRIIGVSAALLTTQLSNVMPAAGRAARLSYSAGTTVLCVLVVLLIASRWLPEPASARLPD